MHPLTEFPAGDQSTLGSDAPVWARDGIDEGVAGSYQPGEAAVMSGAGRGHGEDALGTVDQDDVTVKLAGKEEGVGPAIGQDNVALQGKKESLQCCCCCSCCYCCCFCVVVVVVVVVVVSKQEFNTN